MLSVVQREVQGVVCQISNPPDQFKSQGWNADGQVWAVVETDNLPVSSVIKRAEFRVHRNQTGLKHEQRKQNIDGLVLYVRRIHFERRLDVSGGEA